MVLSICISDPETFVWVSRLTCHSARATSYFISDSSAITTVFNIPSLVLIGNDTASGSLIC